MRTKRPASAAVKHGRSVSSRKLEASIEKPNYVSWDNPGCAFALNHHGPGAIRRCGPRDCVAEAMRNLKIMRLTKGKIVAIVVAPLLFGACFVVAASYMVSGVEPPSGMEASVGAMTHSASGAGPAHHGHRP
jgi:hypothetical protein